MSGFIERFYERLAAIMPHQTLVRRYTIMADYEADPHETCFDKDYVLIAEKDRNPF